MAANQNIQDRLAALNITSGFSVGTKAITLTGTYSESQLAELERTADTQGWQRTLAAGVFTFSPR